MSAVMASAAIERSCGIETIPHLTTRDWTIMGLESVLFGAHAEGVRNILAVTGDPPEVGDYPGSRGVYELDSIGLTALIAQLNRGEDFNGRPIDAPTSFHIGVAVNPSADDLDFELDRFHRKIAAGAAFAMTQLVFDLDTFDHFLDRLGGSSPLPLLLGVCPLWSYQLALRFHNELPGSSSPSSCRTRSGTPARTRRTWAWRTRSACSPRRATASRRLPRRPVPEAAPRPRAPRGLTRRGPMLLRRRAEPPTVHCLRRTFPASPSARGGRCRPPGPSLLREAQPYFAVEGASTSRTLLAR